MEDVQAAARATAAVRATVGAPDDAVSAWRRVSRLDGRPPYLLVGVSWGAAGFVAAVSDDGEVQVWAADASGARAWWTQVSSELVWAPGWASRSPLYPLQRTVDRQLLDHRGEPVSEGPHASG